MRKNSYISMRSAADGFYAETDWREREREREREGERERELWWWWGGERIAKQNIGQSSGCCANCKALKRVR